MKSFNVTYEVTYSKKVGGVGTILISAPNKEIALKRAKNACFTGSDFRNAVLSEKEYVKTTKQGFAGSNRI